MAHNIFTINSIPNSQGLGSKVNEPCQKKLNKTKYIYFCIYYLIDIDLHLHYGHYPSGTDSGTIVLWISGYHMGNAG